MATAKLPRCEIIPLPNRRARFQIDGSPVTTWHFHHDAPRPFFYPVLGPEQTELTRMGHPGAPNHDHNRSVWFAHHKVLGIDFWSDRTTAVIRQVRWLAYEDGDEEARMGVELEWRDGHEPRPLLKQTLLVAVIPDERGQWSLELQSHLIPTSNLLELGRTNFGLLAVRVARSISVRFGGGALQDSEGRVGERAMFGRRAEWVDYSGSARSGESQVGRRVGISVMDHPSNPTHPCHWHVREDGWMGASLCYADAIELTPAKPLKLRYQLWMHDGGCEPEAIGRRYSAFAASSPMQLVTRPAPHRQFGIRRPAG